VAEQELDLFDVSAILAAELRARTTGWAKIGDTSRNGDLCTFAENQRNVFNNLGGRCNSVWLIEKWSTHFFYIADCKRPL
jgi:hypothetical protein